MTPPRSRPPATPPRSKRAFLRQVAEELPSHLPPSLRGFSLQQWGHFIKVWYRDPKFHFEAQFLGNGALEVGFHMEAGEAHNEEMAARLERKASLVRARLGAEARFGSHGPRWRSLSETWRGGDLTGEEAATEVSARLAEYIRALHSIVEADSAGT